MDEGAKMAKERTIGDELNVLEEVSEKLNALVFGGTPGKASDEKTPVAGDSLTRTRNRIKDAVERLQNVAKRLRIIE